MHILIGRKDIPRGRKRRYCSCNYQRCCSCIICVPNLICCVVGTLTVALFIVGILGFALFLVQSIQIAKQDRTQDFDVVFRTLEKMVTAPTVLADAVMAAIKSGLLDLTDSSPTLTPYEKHLDFLYYAMEENFDKFGMDAFALMAWDPWQTRYLVTWHDVNGFVHLFRRYRGIDDPFSFTEDSTYVHVCRVYHPITRQCLGNIPYLGKYINSPYVPYRLWNDTSLNEPQNWKKMFAEPYIFLCEDPDDSNCGLYFTYYSPAHHPVTQEYIGRAGYALQSEKCSRMLGKNIPEGTKAYVIDVVHQVMIMAGDNNEILTLNWEVVPREPLYIYEHPNKRVREINNMLKELHGEDFDIDFENGVTYQISDSGDFIDYKMYTGNSVRWLVIRYATIFDYYAFFTGFTVFFAIVLCCSLGCACYCSCLLTCCISYPLRKLQKKMNRAGKLKIEKVGRGYSWLGEVNRLQRKFYKLVDRLEQYRAFLPEFLKHQDERLVDDDDEGFVDRDKNATNIRDIMGGEDDMSSDVDSSTDGSSTRDSEITRDSTGRSVSSFGSGLSSSVLRKGRRGMSIFATKVLVRRISIVRILWRTKISSRRSAYFVERHTDLTSSLIFMAKKYKATVDIIDEKSFSVAFNVDINLKNVHPRQAARFSLDFLNLAKRKSFDVYLSILTGKSQIALLGSHTLRKKVVIGRMLELGFVLCKFLQTKVYDANRRVAAFLDRKKRSEDEAKEQAESNLGIEVSGSENQKLLEEKEPKEISYRIITNHDAIEPLNLRKFKVTPRDLVYLRGIGVCPVYSIQNHRKLVDTEWMYKVDHDKRIERHSKIFKIFHRFQNSTKEESQIESCLAELDELFDAADQVDDLRETMERVLLLKNEDENLDVNDVVEANRDRKRKEEVSRYRLSMFEIKLEHEVGKVVVQFNTEDGNGDDEADEKTPKEVTAMGNVEGHEEVIVVNEGEIKHLKFDVDEQELDEEKKNSSPSQSEEEKSIVDPKVKESETESEPEEEEKEEEEATDVVVYQKLDEEGEVEFIHHEKENEELKSEEEHEEESVIEKKIEEEEDVIENRRELEDLKSEEDEVEVMDLEDTENEEENEKVGISEEVEVVEKKKEEEESSSDHTMDGPSSMSSAGEDFNLEEIDERKIDGD